MCTKSILDLAYDDVICCIRNWLCVLYSILSGGGGWTFFRLWLVTKTFVVKSWKPCTSKRMKGGGGTCRWGFSLWSLLGLERKDWTLDISRITYSFVSLNFRLYVKAFSPKWCKMNETEEYGYLQKWWFIKLGDLYFNGAKIYHPLVSDHDGQY